MVRKQYVYGTVFGKLGTGAGTDTGEHGISRYGCGFRTRIRRSGFGTPSNCGETFQSFSKQEIEEEQKLLNSARLAESRFRCVNLRTRTSVPVVSQFFFYFLVGWGKLKNFRRLRRDFFAIKVSTTCTSYFKEKNIWKIVFTRAKQISKMVNVVYKGTLRVMKKNKLMCVCHLCYKLQNNFLHLRTCYISSPVPVHPFWITIRVRTFYEPTI